VKIMAIVDRHGLPLSVSTYAANHHEVTLVQLSFEFCMIEAKPQNLIGDRAYDSDQLDEQLRREGVEMIAPHRSNRKRKTQDGRRLRRYERRWIVERFFAWIQWRRRLLVRWEYYARNFLGFVQLAAICILLRQFWDCRVEDWRGAALTGSSCSPAEPVPQSASCNPFPVPAHRTGQADLPHPALGQDRHAFAHGRAAVSRDIRRSPSRS
jgi:transposase